MTLESELYSRMLKARGCLQSLLERINQIENDLITPVAGKRAEIKKIQDEITKVGEEIDNIKREFKLLNAYRVN